MASNVPGLDAKIQKVVEAAIAAEMSDFGYYGTCADGFDGYSRATEESPITDSIRVTYPEGHVYAFGNRSDHLEPNFSGAYAHVTDLYSKWDEEIKQNFERFDDLPTPEGFDFSIERLGILATALDAGGAYLDGSGSDARTSLGNADLAGYVDAIGSDLSGFRGDAIEALNGSYLSRTSTVIAGQQVLMVTLGIVVTGEREVWVRTREDLLEIADSAEAAFLDYAGGGGGGSLKTTFLVLGAIATAATAFTGAGMIVTAAALNAAGTFLPETPPEPELEFAGGSVSEVHGHLLMALSDQCRVIADVERAFADCADAAVASSVANPDYHDFATPGDPVPFLQAGEDAEYFGPGESLAVHGPELREAAGKVEAVAQVLQHVCHDLPTLSSWSWDRYHVVGYGRYGHHGETQGLAQHLEGLLQGSATRMNEVAEKMVLVSYDFEATEQQIADELRQRLAEVPDPTPNQDVEYGHPADAG